MLHLEFSNRLESLFDSLFEALSDAPSSAFTADEIIVPSVAFRRKIELSIADRRGICANTRFSFLAQWLWRQMGRVIAIEEVSPFTPSILCWRIFRILHDDVFVASYERLSNYLKHADELMRYELAIQIASLIEQYITYRPDWLRAWSEGKLASVFPAERGPDLDQEWQSGLWRRIAAELGTKLQHPSVSFFDKVESGVNSQANLPAIAHLFCLPEMPPLYLDILRQFSRWMDLRIYVLNPCREYWFDIVDRRRMSYLSARGEAGYHETGNRLLALWGKQSQSYIELLLADSQVPFTENSHFPSGGQDTLLGRLQDAVLDLVDLTPGSVILEASDRSLEVHVCHSLTRELEVLQDQLLGLFGGPNPPRPSEILVVTPNLTEASPLIDAVFGTPPPARRIPYIITGQPASVYNPVARTLIDLLALVDSRFIASDVFQLLQQPIVFRKFGLVAAELDLIHTWIRDSGIRWGIDAGHRTDSGLPGFARHSLRDGLQRLFLGYALPANIASSLNDRLPEGNPEGSQTRALGNFWRFAEKIASLPESFLGPRGPEEWVELLFGMIDSFFEPLDEDIENFRETQAAIRELQSDMLRGQVETPLSLDIIRKALRDKLDDALRGGVPTGSVTFASLNSLRNLPYRVVCVIGLNDGAFPTVRSPLEFDLMAVATRKGDRQRRFDERNLFLDLLLSAQDRLYLSYSGRSVRDNSIQPPSVLISDLLDYVSAAIAVEPTASGAIAEARARLTVEHPLQAFSADCFDPNGDRRRMSFNEEYCNALKNLIATSSDLASAPEFDRPTESSDEEVWEPAAPFFAAPLPEAGEEWRTIPLVGLIDFFRNPSSFLLWRRLKIELPKVKAELLDDEPFIADWPERTAFAKRLLQPLLENIGMEKISSLARSGLEYPEGLLGALQQDRELHHLREFSERIRRDLCAPCLPPHQSPLAFDIAGQNWQLTGTISGLRPHGLVCYRYDEIRAGDYLIGWINHLFLNATANGTFRPRTTWYGRKGVFHLEPLENPEIARAHLRGLLELYRQGLREPLHFYPKSAWEYVSNNRSLSKAWAKWQNSVNSFGESQDPAYRLALRGCTDPLDSFFRDNAERVFGPLWKSLEIAAKS